MDNAFYNGEKFLISYNNLWKILIDKNMKRTDLIEKAGISSSTLANMGKNQCVSLETIARVCDALDCEIGDVVAIEKSKEKAKSDAEEQPADKKKEVVLC